MAGLASAVCFVALFVVFVSGYEPRARFLQRERRFNVERRISKDESMFPNYDHRFADYVVENQVATGGVESCLRTFKLLRAESTCSYTKGLYYHALKTWPGCNFIMDNYQEPCENRFGDNSVVTYNMA